MLQKCDDKQKKNTSQKKPIGRFIRSTPNQKYSIVNNNNL